MKIKIAPVSELYSLIDEGTLRYKCSRYRNLTGNCLNAQSGYLHPQERKISVSKGCIGFF